MSSWVGVISIVMLPLFNSCGLDPSPLAENQACQTMSRLKQSQLLPVTGQEQKELYRDLAHIAFEAQNQASEDLTLTYSCVW